VVDLVEQMVTAGEWKFAAERDRQPSREHRFAFRRSPVFEYRQPHRIGVSRRLDAELCCKQLTALAVRGERCRTVARRGESGHQSAVGDLGERITRHRCPCRIDRDDMISERGGRCAQREVRPSTQRDDPLPFPIDPLAVEPGEQRPVQNVCGGAGRLRRCGRIILHCPLRALDERYSVDYVDRHVRVELVGAERRTDQFPCGRIDRCHGSPELGDGAAQRCLPRSRQRITPDRIAESVTADRGAGEGERSQDPLGNRAAHAAPVDDGVVHDQTHSAGQLDPHSHDNSMPVPPNARFQLRRIYNGSRMLRAMATQRDGCRCSASSANAVS
jgi:hypothetical protein